MNSKNMNTKPTIHTPEVIQAILSKAVAQAEVVAATCVGIHKAITPSETPEVISPWYPFESREEWQEFDAALDRCLEKRAAQQRSVA